MPPSSTRSRWWGLPLLAVATSAEPLPAYSEGEALQFLELARVSFCDDPAITHWVCGEACLATRPLVVRGRAKVIGPGEEAGVKGYAAQLLDRSSGVRRCVLAFRGSVNVENWLTDARIMLAHWPPWGEAAWCEGCKVHGGFAAAYDELRNDTLASLRDLGCELVDVTGHSLGAGAATIAAMDLRGSGVQVRMLWTYGSPRVGNPSFVKAFMALATSQGAPVASWRVVHYHDPVPQGGPGDYYMHVPNQVFYSRDSSSYEVCPPVTWDGDAVVRPQCGMNKVAYSEITAGLVKQDHVNYLNRSLALKHMDAKCHFQNFCFKNGLQYSLLEMIVACLVSAALGATLTPFVRRRLSEAKKSARNVEEDSDYIDGDSSSTELSSKS